YNQFSAFVKENDFEYESQSKQMLEDLIKQAKEEKYYELASGEFEKIKAKLEPQLDKDLTVFSEEIKSLLKNEIVSRFYYQKGAIRASIGEDEVILKAVDELKSPMSYTSHFEPGIIITMKRP
ncbi:MAG: peptidase S41, partial [Bacteroidales bacterium]|nr:peptidase S41 [Bacteroidales bacterium]